MSKRKALGRGLGALLPTDSGADTGKDAGIRTISIDAIQPNPRQPRTEFDQVKLQELADSIAEHGLIQPLIVTEDRPGQYILIAGERRWRASKLAGYDEIPVVVKEASAQERLEWALIENVQRADLNPIEEAMAYQQMTEDFGLTQEEVARRVGKSRSEVANRLGLLRLPLEVQQAVSSGLLTYGHARALGGLPTPEAQLNLMKVVIERDLSVRETEAIVKKWKSGRKPPPKPRPRHSPEMVALEESFQTRLSTKVKIEKDRKGAGKVVIHFYSDEELDAIYNVIVGRED